MLTPFNNSSRRISLQLSCCSIPEPWESGIDNAGKAVIQVRDTLLLSPLVYAVVTVSTQREQVLLGVGTGSTAKFFVMNLQVVEAATALTSPPIPLQHLSTKLFVRFPIQSYACLLWPNLTHDAF
jgi:hypothetical protein